jgi:hypothetical protein
MFFFGLKFPHLLVCISFAYYKYKQTKQLFGKAKFSGFLLVNCYYKEKKIEEARNNGDNIQNQ